MGEALQIERKNCTDRRDRELARRRKHERDCKIKRGNVHARKEKFVRDRKAHKGETMLAAKSE